MWSLFRKKGDGQGIFEYSGEKLEPLLFSNNKTQADVVREILEAINQGEKIIFIRGVCGTGKSVIALNLARHFNKTSIVVPIKSLQEQYEQDYTQKMFLLKKDNKKLKISVIKGRNNFECPFLNENSQASFNSAQTADNAELPCTIEIREKNFDKIKDYIKQNEFVDIENFNSIKDVRRMSIAPSCPYWSPLLPAKLSSDALEHAVKRKYSAVSDKEYALYQRKRGCKYYDQYLAYTDSDVLIFNSMKYIIETLIGRKPKTDLDIIDECDEFLDNFCQEKKINLNRLYSAISNLPPRNIEEKASIQSLLFLINDIIFNYEKKEVEKLEKTEIINLVTKILENKYLAEDEEENYYNRVLEICLEFQDFLQETYVLFSREKRKDQLFSSKETEICHLSLVTINLAKKFKELADKTKVLVLMSGTLHSEQILKDIFNIEKFKIIEAETIMPGTIAKLRIGLEKNCKYENFMNGTITRKDFLLALNSCVEKAKKPVLIHVNSFSDLPNSAEKQEFSLNNLITKEKLLELQEKNNIEIEKFKTKKIDILFTTKCSRGIDFPGDQCNSIILTRYPYPDIKSLFWQILKKEKPNQFLEFYLDKAKRELLQKIYRGVRCKSDHILLLSPDSRVLNERL